jgi:hypothetical protein
LASSNRTNDTRSSHLIILPPFVYISISIPATDGANDAVAESDFRYQPAEEHKTISPEEIANPNGDEESCQPNQWWTEICSPTFAIRRAKEKRATATKTSVDLIADRGINLEAISLYTCTSA